MDVWFIIEINLTYTSRFETEIVYTVYCLKKHLVR